MAVRLVVCSILLRPKMTTRKQLIGQIQRPGQRPEDVRLTLQDVQPVRSADDIQRLIDFTAADGGVVQLDPGTYLLDKSIEMRSGVTLRGAGWKTVLKLADSSVASLTSIQSGTVAAMIYADADDITDFAIENLAIDGML